MKPEKGQMPDAATIAEIKKNSRRVENGKAIVSQVIVRHPGQEPEIWRTYEDGTESFKKGSATITEFSEQPVFRAPLAVDEVEK